MHAALYIEKIHYPLTRKHGALFEAAIRRRDLFPPAASEAQAAQQEAAGYYSLMYAEGYFRDPYNVAGLLGRLGLAWWTDVMPLCTEDRKLCGVELRRFRDMVAQARLTLPSKAELQMQRGVVEDTGRDSLAEWHNYFIEKRAYLLEFLNKAIELNSAVYCSL